MQNKRFPICSDLGDSKMATFSGISVHFDHVDVTADHILFFKDSRVIVLLHIVDYQWLLDARIFDYTIKALPKRGLHDTLNQDI